VQKTQYEKFFTAGGNLILRQRRTSEGKSRRHRRSSVGAHALASYADIDIGPRDQESE
jgi:hypothetical protein